ncbi:hypothetical protein Tco_0657482 [Tanacetum coccineum]|uniref:Uncharacterized protein n=1 Tax=Tanacetum coccineum TaxID=301880 RepID=A0ABQ4XBQ1_9ASTR
MSSPHHPTSNLEDAFSSNFPNYVPPASSDYVPASPGKLTLFFNSLEFPRKRRIIIQQDFDALEAELQQARAQITKLQRKQMNSNHKISLAASESMNWETLSMNVKISSPSRHRKSHRFHHRTQEPME